MTEHCRTRALPSKFVLAVTVGGVIGLGILPRPIRREYQLSRDKLFH